MENKQSETKISGTTQRKFSDKGGKISKSKPVPASTSKPKNK